jgi:CelD/BcsL family acetyltransferase involved in cellulose biosynthesis
MIRVTEINEIHELLELRNEWNDVLARSRDKHIFLTWEYLSTYWRHFGKDKKLRILCIEDKNKIIAIAPLRQSRYGFAGPLGYDVIEPLGYRGLTPEGADYTGLILVEREAECLQLFLNHLVEHNDWDFIYLMDIPETSINPNLLAKISKAIPLTFKLEKGAICPYISIPNSMDIFLKELGGKFRKDLQRCMRNLEKDYHRVELKRYDEFGSVEESMKIFFELHQERWKRKNMPGVFNTEEVRDFYLDVAKLFADNGWLALYFLTANDEPIATQYCFEYKQKMYYALGGFDPGYSQYSVGNLAFTKVVEKCIERKIEEYDLLKGGESYKFRFTAKYRTNLGIRFVNKGFASNFYHWGTRMVKQTKMDKLFGKFLNF